MPFTFTPLEIPEIIEVVPKQFQDGRGVFTELFKQSDFEATGLAASFTQINQSISSKGVLRGLHYQKNPSAQGKLVSVMKGEIFDVAVDIRQGSPTYGKWVSKVLNSTDKNMLYIPAGFAHGLFVMSDEAQVVYYCTAEYAPQEERGIMWNDATIGVTWPTQDPILSEKDTKYPDLAGADNNFTL